MGGIDFILRQWHTPSAARHLMMTTERDTQRPYLGSKSEEVVAAATTTPWSRSRKAGTTINITI